MHSVERSPEPEFLARMRNENAGWDELDGGDRRRIRNALVRDFGPICAYCERPCEWPNKYRDSPNQETIDHFRPRYRFPHLWLDWLNLVYACRRCNDAKDNSWPGFDDQSVDMWLKAENPRYTPVSEYVCPNAEAGRSPAVDYFSYDDGTGEISPAEQLSDEEWSMARRTIVDIDLNDRNLGENDQGHLWNLRKTQLGLIMHELNSLQDPFQKVRLARAFTLPDKPFSSFVAAYFKHHFPEF